MSHERDLLKRYATDYADGHAHRKCDLDECRCGLSGLNLEVMALLSAAHESTPAPPEPTRAQAEALSGICAVGDPHWQARADAIEAALAELKARIRGYAEADRIWTEEFDKETLSTRRGQVAPVDTEGESTPALTPPHWSEFLKHLPGGSDMDREPPVAEPTPSKETR